MEAVQSSNIILVIADSNFINLCVDPFEYLGRLKTLITKRMPNGVTFYTVSGKYGVGHIDNSITAIQIDDKNKTIFGQTLENNTLLFDELLAISIVPTDPFISVAREVVMNASKTITQYGYNRK